MDTELLPEEQVQNLGGSTWNSFHLPGLYMQSNAELFSMNNFCFKEKFLREICIQVPVCT